MNENGVTSVERAYFIRGRGKYGMDEFSLFPEGTEVTEIRDDKIIGPYVVTSEDFGIEPISTAHAQEIKTAELVGRFTIPGISPPIGKKEKAESSYRILENDMPERLRNFVKANVSPILVLFDEAQDLRDGFEAAEQLLSEKHGLKTAELFVQSLEDYSKKHN